MTAPERLSKKLVDELSSSFPGTYLDDGYALLRVEAPATWRTELPEPDRRARLLGDLAPEGTSVWLVGDCEVLSAVFDEAVPSGEAEEEELAYSLDWSGPTESVTRWIVHTPLNDALIANLARPETSRVFVASGEWSFVVSLHGAVVMLYFYSEPRLMGLVQRHALVKW
jgi:hypothetical protein